MKTIRSFMIVAVCSLFLTTASIAQTTSSQTYNKTHYTPDKNTPATQLLERGFEWGLKSEEWLRYEELMKGPRGIYSPGLDPLTVLGIEARSDEERTYFAELQVRAEAARVEKELVYQLAYDAAWKRLYPALDPVSNLEEASTVSISGNGRMAVFVKENCLPCDQKVRQLQTKREPFDIYLVDSHQDDTAVRRWAARAGIDTTKVRSGTITLNHDGGHFKLLNLGEDLPAVVRHAGGRWLRQ